MIKNARTDFQKACNWALKKACELIKNSPESKNKKVEIVWKVTDTKLRQINVNEKVAFVQSEEEGTGTFVAPFTDLSLS